MVMVSVELRILYQTNCYQWRDMTSALPPHTPLLDALRNLLEREQDAATAALLLGASSAFRSGPRCTDPLLPAAATLADLPPSAHERSFLLALPPHTVKLREGAFADGGCLDILAMHVQDASGVSPSFVAHLRGAAPNFVACIMGGPHHLWEGCAVQAGRENYCSRVFDSSVFVDLRAESFVWTLGALAGVFSPCNGARSTVHWPDLCGTPP